MLSLIRLPVLRSTSTLAFSSRSISTSTVRFNASSPVEEQPPVTEAEQNLLTKLETMLPGSKVQVQDVSGGCGSFYAISIAHESFKGLSTIKQHRVVNELLKEEIKGMHGLQLKTSAE